MDELDSVLLRKGEAQLETILPALWLTSRCFQVSVEIHKRAPRNNPVYDHSVRKQHETGLALLEELLGIPLVVYRDRFAEVARTGVDQFLGVWTDPYTEKVVSRMRDPRHPELPCVQNVFQSAADLYFDRERVDREGRPCRAYEDILRLHATIPEFEERRKPLVQGNVYRYEFPIPDHRASPDDMALDRRAIGELYLQMLSAQFGCSMNEARNLIQPGKLQGFEEGLTQRIGNYRGRIAFEIVQGDLGAATLAIRFLDREDI
ncbi:MAG TPA: hypothetical protein VJK52_06325 [Candidatus Nanoarchaeia archaeon]|nr:hypothetical protein [Candidatus Nanoarchaeia archaeon]